MLASRDGLFLIPRCSAQLPLIPKILTKNASSLKLLFSENGSSLIPLIILTDWPRKSFKPQFHRTLAVNFITFSSVPAKYLGNRLRMAVNSVKNPRKPQTQDSTGEERPKDKLLLPVFRKWTRG